MGFIDEAQEWLRATAGGVLPPGFAMEGRRRTTWTALEALPGNKQETAHKTWSKPGVLERAVLHAVLALRDGIGGAWSVQELEKHVDIVLHDAINYPHQARPGMLGLELHRVAEDLVELAWVAGIGDVPSWCRAVGGVDEAGLVTPVGRTLTSLLGRDALHFALELEVALSTGEADPWRVSRNVLAAMVEVPSRTPHIWQQVRRLIAMSVLREQEDADPELIIDLNNADVVHLVLDPTPTPIRTLVHALLEAQRGQLVTLQTGAPPPSSDLGFARMVIHELRNINLPLSTGLNSLWAELGRAGGPDPARIAPLRERIERSVDRIGAFARDSGRLLAAASPEAFSLRAVVEEAVFATEADRNGRIAVDLGALGDATLEGPRSRWVLLFVNLLRNAAQARAGSGSVWISTEWDLTGKLHVFVDDDGPGVPEELREQILELGVSHRGGSGSGLYDARVTTILSGGTLSCEASPRGGARFHLHVPGRRRA
jgi:signal transduction histidine kinase